jgi:predicted aconitase with swiveling domain
VSVAVLVVRVVQVALDQVVDVVTVGHGLVPAVGSVSVAGVVTGAVVVGGALFGVLVADADGVLLDGAVVADMVQVPVVGVVDVALVG